MTHPEIAPPIERIFDLNRLSEAGYEAEIVLGPAELEKLAAWADVSSVGRFAARVSLRRLAATRFAYAAALDADITQSCTVTLEPVASHVALEFTRTLQLVSQARKTVDFSAELSLAAGDMETPEEIESPRFDLAAPLLEEFLLTIDPYPRAPGVAFETPADPEAETQSPFAVLKNLKG